MKKELMTDEKMIKVCVGMVEQEGFEVSDFTKDLMKQLSDKKITPEEADAEMKKHIDDYLK